MTRIEVCGGIASGKSTLAAVVSLYCAEPVFEDFTANPFFQLFYSDPERYAFETEVTYMLQHYSGIADADIASGRSIVTDFSMALDLAYARVTLQPKDLAVFETVFAHALSKIGCPGLLVKLDCAPEVELGRIRMRARPAEHAITLDYLSKLNQSMEQVLTDRRFKGLKVLRVDSGRLDFRPEGKDKDSVVSQVFAAINP